MHRPGRRPRQPGAGIVMSVNAMRVIGGLDMAAEVEARGECLGMGAITDADGSSLGGIDFSLLAPDFGPTIAIHRADLHEILLAGTSAATIQLDTSVTSLQPHSDGVDVRFTNDVERRYDLVIGADGLRSKVRELVFGDLPLRYSGYTCWRFVVDNPTGTADMCEMWAPGLRFGIVPIGKNRLYCFAVANAALGTEDPEEGRLERFRGRFSSFGGQVPEILSRLESSDQLIHNDLQELVRSPWQRGRIVLIGDAAHAMTPNMGQGAAMALEDSGVLVEMLSEGAPVEETLVGFVARRKSRVDWVQNQSRRIGQVGQWQNALACRMRNQILRWSPDSANSAVLRKLSEKAA